MRKIISLIMASVMCICIFAVGPVSVSAAAVSTVCTRLYDGKLTDGEGNWYIRNSTSTSGTYTTKAVIDDIFVENTIGGEESKVVALNQIENGEGVYYANSFLSYATTSNQFYEEFETYVEVHPTQTDYPITMHIYFRAAEGINAVSLDGGKIKANGEETGYYYKKDATYAFRVLADPVNDTVSTYLVSGPVSTTSNGTFADLGEEKLLKESTGLDSNKIGYMQYVDLRATDLPTDRNVGTVAYFKDIKIERLPAEISLKNEVQAGATTIELKTNSWLASNSTTTNNASAALQGDVIVKRNGKALTYGTDYTVTATSGGRSNCKTFARNPVITLTKAAVAGEGFEIDFSEVSTNRSVKLTDQKFTVRVPGIQETALTKDEVNYTFTVKGTADGYAGTMLVAEYNKATKSLIKVLDIIPVNMEGNFEETYTVENYDSEHEYRAFFWQLLNMTPVLGSAEF